MPCGKGWVTNRALTFKESTFTDRASLVEALQDRGIKDITVTPEAISISRRVLGTYGDVVFQRTGTVYTVNIGEDDLRILNRRYRDAEGFLVGLKKSYNERAVKKIVQKLKGRVTREETETETVIQVRW